MDTANKNYVSKVQREVESLAAHKNVLEDIRAVWFDREYSKGAKSEIKDEAGLLPDFAFDAATLQNAIVMLIEVLDVLDKNRVNISKIRTDL